jgi:membrane fusion protein (multidrug efflux system)
MRSRRSLPDVIPLLAPALMAATLALGACKGAASDAEAADSAAVATAGGDTAATTPVSAAPVNLPVVAEEVTDGDLILTVNTTGQVRSEASSQLKAEVAGTVEAVLAKPGDRVNRGQAIVRLDMRPFDLAVREAQASVEESRLKWLDQFVPDSIATGKGPGEERRRNARTRSGLDAAELRLERAQLDRERATILAPFDGVVDRLDVARGERVTAGQPVTTIVDLQHLRVEASVLEHDLPLIRVGGQALVSSAAAREQMVTGTVSAVLPLVDSTSRSGRAFVRVPGSAALRPGMYADVRLEANRLTNRRLVPARAVIERDGRPLVFVVQEGRAKWTYIQPGRSNGVLTEVLPDSASGQIPLNAGDLVIVEGHLTLTHDAPVRVAAKKEP